jgi:hypothetical protein
MPTLLENIANRLTRKKQELYDARVCSVRSVLWQSAQEKRGVKIAKPLDENEATEVMEAADDLDIPRTMQVIDQRIAWGQQCENFEEKKKAAEVASAALTEFRRAEAERVLATRETLQKLQHAEHVAMSAFAAADHAREELLATGEAHPDAAALEQQQTELSRAIDRCKSALDRLSGKSYVARVTTAKAHLENKDLRPKDRAHYESELRAAEKGIEAATEELPKLEKQLTAIQAKQANLAELKLKPENFAIVRKSKREMAVA